MKTFLAISIFLLCVLWVIGAFLRKWRDQDRHRCNHRAYQVYRKEESDLLSVIRAHGGWGVKVDGERYV